MRESKRVADLRHYRIICFTDAGFATLLGDRIIESNVEIIGRVLFREGPIRRRGFLMDHRCAEIQRACRSSLSAECHAAVTAGDYALRYPIILIELMTRRYQIRKLCPPENFSMLNAFGNPPTGAKLKYGKLFAIHQEFDPPIIAIDETILRSKTFCKERRIGIVLFTTERNIERSEASDDSTDPEESDELLKPILLTDCCSLFSSIHRTNQMHKNDVP